MKISKLRVRGFRLLEDVEILLEPSSTVIVGRNNSGKTSLTDVVDKLVGDKAGDFRLEDFSAGIRTKFLQAKELVDGGAPTDQVVDALPLIAVTLTITYDASEELGTLAPFVIDVDPTVTTALIEVRYAVSPIKAKELFAEIPSDDTTETTVSLYRRIKETIPKTYSLQLSAIDPSDPSNKRDFEGLAPLQALLQCGVVRAQRTLDDKKQGDTAVIGRLLGTLFKTATATTAAQSDQSLASALKNSVDVIEKDIQSGFDDMLKGLLPALAVFGFPSLNDTELKPLTSLNVETLLADHTRVFYAGSHGVHLPEGYNGLGTRNLIYMLLQLETFHKAYRAKPTRPGLHLIFIEEPEAHLHPQMQEVFIRQLNAAAKALSAKYSGEDAWAAQFVVSTHSSHVANTASFEAIRYFLSAINPGTEFRQTNVKDFRKGLGQTSSTDREFLHQYMTLTKCDLYFADKAILVEGTTERILMPRLISIVDEKIGSEAKLAHQYITTIEIGGAYAQAFYPLIDFLELKTLIITDLDAVYLDTSGEKKKWKKCPCAKGARSSNAAINAWFSADNDKTKQGEKPSPSIQELIEKPEVEKLKGFRRIAYQVPEPGSNACARSFEDALVLANPKHFVVQGTDKAEGAWEMAQDMPKAETAIQFAMRQDEWNVPHYISEGLLWLSEPPPAPDEAPPLSGAQGDAS